MSTRTEMLKKYIMGNRPKLCVERARIITKAYKETESLPPIIRRAKALEKILDEMSIYINPDSFIVGNLGSAPRVAPIFPEMGVDFIEKELETFSSRPYDKFIVTEECKEELLSEIIPYWKGKTHEDRVNSYSRMLFSNLNWQKWDPTFNPVVNNGAHRKTGSSCICVDYEKVIKRGLIGIINEAEKELESVNICNVDGFAKYNFLQSIIITYKRAIRFAIRFSKEANKLARSETRPWRKKELKKIAEICRKVPAYPAKTFWEALQLLWFIHLILQIETNGHAIAMGRFDQILYPYYKHDILEGRISKDQALELIECFLIKCNEINKVREWPWTSYSSGYQMFMDITLGGQLSDGRDATNELSYLCLEALGNLKLPQPTVIVALHSKTPEEFLEKCCETLVKHGGGMPSFFNSEVIIPILLSQGASLEDARNWALVGCSEPVVPGKTNSYTYGSSIINLAKVLELALNNGIDPESGIQLRPGIAKLSTFNSFNEVLKAFEEQLKFWIELATKLDAITSLAYAELTPLPFRSGLFEGRVKYGKDLTQGYKINYNKNIIHGQGTANIGNSLAAIKYLVFDKKIISPSELEHALKVNFEGKEAEEIRQILIHQVPKYGNDNDYVDLITKEAVNLFADIARRHIPWIGGRYAPTLQTISGNVPAGIVTGATPDGRKAGEPLADNVSPSPRDDVNGPTATIKSVTKLDHEKFGCGTILNLKFHPTSVSTIERRRKFAALIKTFFQLKGFQVQFNIVSTDVLKAAQKNPNKYPNLVVKVAGYSALFSLLDKKLQDQIIKRTEHIF